MATTYTSAAAQSTSPAFQVSERGVMMVAYGEYTLTSAAELGTINNVIEMVKVPAGAKIMGLLAEMVDNDGGTSFTLDIGDGGSTARFVAASTVGQAAGYVTSSSLVAASLGYRYTSADTIDFLVHAAPASAAATSGTVRLRVDYIVT
jgi:hypothetical protein